jgi:hypothetical protein
MAVRIFVKRRALQRRELVEVCMSARPDADPAKEPAQIFDGPPIGAAAGCQY